MYTQQDWESFLEECEPLPEGAVFSDGSDEEEFKGTDGTKQQSGSKKRADADGSAGFDWDRFFSEQKGTRRLRKEQG